MKKILLCLLLIVFPPVGAKVEGVWVPNPPEPKREEKIYFDFEKDCRWMELNLQNKYTVMAFVCIPETELRKMK